MYEGNSKDTKRFYLWRIEEQIHTMRYENISNPMNHGVLGIGKLVGMDNTYLPLKDHYCTYNDGVVESIIHALHVWRVARQIWIPPVKGNYWTIFFNLNLQERIHYNLQKQLKQGRSRRLTSYMGNIMSHYMVLEEPNRACG